MLDVNLRLATTNPVVMLSLPLIWIGLTALNIDESLADIAHGVTALVRGWMKYGIQIPSAISGARNITVNLPFLYIASWPPEKSRDNNNLHSSRSKLG